MHMELHVYYCKDWQLLSVGIHGQWKGRGSVNNGKGHIDPLRVGVLSDQYIENWNVYKYIKKV